MNIGFNPAVSIPQPSTLNRPTGPNGESLAQMHELLTGTKLDVPERFISSQQGGVIVGKDGEPAGSVPPGSFLDTKSGNVFTPDGKKVELPEGSSVDFFDLPSVSILTQGPGVPGPLGGAAPQPMTGPQGEPLWQTSTAMGGCDHHGAGAVVAGVPAAAGPVKGEVAGAKGGGDTAGLEPAAKSLVAGGAAASAVDGVSGLGDIGGLESILTSLLETLNQLVAALTTQIAGGGSSPVQQTDVGGASGKGEPATKGEPTTEVGGESGKGSTTQVGGESGKGSTTQVGGESGAGDSDDSISDDSSSSDDNVVQQGGAPVKGGDVGGESGSGDVAKPTMPVVGASASTNDSNDVSGTGAMSIEEGWTGEYAVGSTRTIIDEEGNLSTVIEGSEGGTAADLT